jgi:hypothetical protein
MNIHSPPGIEGERPSDPESLVIRVGQNCQQSMSIKHRPIFRLRGSRKKSYHGQSARLAEELDDDAPLTRPHVEINEEDRRWFLGELP